MIIVKLVGGLGNQMFQYAAARSLSLRLGVSLKLDLSFLEGNQTGDTSRLYKLNHFCLISEKASLDEASKMSGRGKSFLPTVFGQFFQMRVDGKSEYIEKSFHYDPQLLGQPDNVYLVGYWQSERYFADINEVIRSDFTFKNPLADKNRELADEIQAVNSVSLHIRRGDYVMDEKIRAIHGGCGLEYYVRAEGWAAQKIEHPHFFVFSDDPVWVRENFKMQHPMTLVSHNGPEQAYEDLRLMSLCSHHIIANSTFSWWGAWLNPHPDKIVIAPMRWFNDPAIDTSDLIPSSWQRIMI